MSDVQVSCVADIRRTLITSILSDLHEGVRSVCQNFLMRVGQLTPDSHLWLLQLLAENMREADSKPQHRSCYYDLFAWALTKIPKDNQVVSRSSSCSTCSKQRV